MMESSSSTIASLLLGKLLTSIFLHADNSLSFFHNHKILQFLRYFLVKSFLFFLSLLPSLFSSLHDFSNFPPNSNSNSNSDDNRSAAAACGGGGGGSGVSRALSQLLLLMNDIPVSSRKYEVVRSLAEKLIDENLIEQKPALTEVNCAVLSAAFARTLRQLEAAAMEEGGGGGGGGELAASEGDCGRARRLVKGVKYYGKAAWRLAKPRSEVRRGGSGSSAEKLAAEVLWLAQKMAASGCAEEAVCKWAAAVKLAWLALSTEPRLQGSLVKVSAFLIRQAKEVSKEEEEQQQQMRATKMRMLMSWLPLLCSANNGTDAPVLSMAERAELETILEEVIWTLTEEEQEMVLSLWLHHFTYCPASDWPNLRSCYTRWYNASRDTLLRQHTS